MRSLLVVVCASLPGLQAAATGSGDLDAGAPATATAGSADARADVDRPAGSGMVPVESTFQAPGHDQESSVPGGAPMVAWPPITHFEDNWAPGMDAPLDILLPPGTDITSLSLEQLLETTVVSATKSEIKEDLAPAITTVVTREAIQQWGYASVAEVLRHVVGLYVIDDHIIPNVSVRGVSGGLRSESGLIKVMIDGQAVAFRATAGNWLGPELVPLSAVQRIEIIRGPGSALYGADAFLGVINVVTRRPDKMNGGEFAVGGNYQGQAGWGQDASGGASLGRFQLLASFRTLSEDRSGLRLPPSSPAPRLSGFAPADLTARNLNLRSTAALTKLSYRFGGKGFASLMGYFSEIERGAEFADWAQLTNNLDPEGRMQGTQIALRHGMVGLDVVVPLGETLDFHLASQGFTGGPTSRDRIEVGSSMYYVKRDFGFSGFAIEGETSWHPIASVSVLSGVGFVLDHETLPMVYQVMKTSVAGAAVGSERALAPGGGAVNLENTGAHVLVLWAPHPRLGLTAGVRYDYHNVYGGKPSARLGGVVQINRSLHLKLLYGSAFKAPSPQLLYGSPIIPGDITGNRDLKPSYLHTVEGQLVFRPKSYLVLSSGLAYSYLLDKAEFAQVGVNLAARNISKVESVSWESEFRFAYRRRFDAYASLSLNRTAGRTEETGYLALVGAYTNPAYPSLVAHAGASTFVPGMPLRLSVEGSWVSARASSITNALDADGRYELRPYFLLGGTLRTVGIHLVGKKETVLLFAVRNALDIYITDPGFAGIDYPRRGRNFMFQLLQEW